MEALKSLLKKYQEELKRIEKNLEYQNEELENLLKHKDYNGLKYKAEKCLLLQQKKQTLEGLLNDLKLELYCLEK